jgi:hypothetical protein
VRSLTFAFHTETPSSAVAHVRLAWDAPSLPLASGPPRHMLASLDSFSGSPGAEGSSGDLALLDQVGESERPRGMFGDFRGGASLEATRASEREREREREGVVGAHIGLAQNDLNGPARWSKSLADDGNDGGARRCGGAGVGPLPHGTLPRHDARSGSPGCCSLFKYTFLLKRLDN